MRVPSAPYTKKELPPLELGYERHGSSRRCSPRRRTSLRSCPRPCDGSSRGSTSTAKGCRACSASTATRSFYKQNLGGGALAPARSLLSRPRSARLGRGGQQFIDLDGDGTQGSRRASPPRWPGISIAPRTGELRSAFRPFASQPRSTGAIPTCAPSISTATGTTTCSSRRTTSFVWYPSLGQGGFGRRIRFPEASRRGAGARARVRRRHCDSIFLADMSGDGLTDLVRDRERQRLLLAQPRLRPVRREGHDGRRAVRSTTRSGSIRARPARRHRRLGHHRRALSRPRRRPHLRSTRPAIAWRRADRARRASAGSTRSSSRRDGRPARHRHRVPGLVVAAARRAAARCATSICSAARSRTCSPRYRNNLGLETTTRVRAVDEVLPRGRAAPAGRG